MEARIIDPGNEFSKPKIEKLRRLEDWITRHPDCTLASGEARLLLDEIIRLRQSSISRGVPI